MLFISSAKISFYANLQNNSLEIFVTETAYAKGSFYEDYHEFHLYLILVAYFKNNTDFCV